jgi:hypothetical protein
MTNEHSTYKREPDLTKEERMALEDERKRFLRGKANRVLAEQRMAPFACIVVDRATGEHFLMTSASPR